MKLLQIVEMRNNFKFYLFYYCLFFFLLTIFKKFNYIIIIFQNYNKCMEYEYRIEDIKSSI